MRLGVRQQIGSLPAIAVLIFGIGIAAGIVFATNALSLLGQVASTDYPRLDHVKALTTEVARVTDDFNAAVAEGEKKKLDEASERAVAIRAIITRIGALQGQDAFAKKVRSHFEAYYEPAGKAARVMLGVDKGESKPSVDAMQSAIRNLNAELEKGTRDAEAAFSASLTGAQTGIRNVLGAMIAAGVLVTVLLALLSWLIVRSIWKQLGGEPEDATRIVKDIARGNLSTPIHVATGDTHSQLAALKGMQAGLAELITNIRQSAGSVRNSSHEIAMGMTELSSRTEQQASSLEETASAMEELTATVTQNAQHAVRARDLALASTQVATKGGDAVREVVATMDEIDASSKQIASIVAVIDGIAFQTNILALNAAVEAARAGEQGRGFAVVASEVRSLAHRSAASAKEIKSLIDQSLGKVGAGRRLVASTGATITQVVDSINEVSGVVKEISTASLEQSAGISEMGRAVTQIEGVTQHNAALVEETSAAAQSMTDQARKLEQAVSVFQLQEAGRDELRLSGGKDDLRLSSGKKAQYGVRKALPPK